MGTPTYPGAIDLFKSRGAVILTVPVDNDSMRTDILMNLCDKYSPKIIYTMPNFHNPTGYSMSFKRKRELLDIDISFLPGTVCYPNEVEFNYLRICFTYLKEDLENTIIELCKLMELLNTTENSSDYIPII